jgi:hypothetical protein
MGSSRLLRLPFELRLMIFDFVIRLPSSPPPMLEAGTAEERVICHVHRPIYADKTPDVVQRVFFPSNPPRNPALPLLLVNRQIYAETLRVLPRAKKGKLQHCRPEDPWFNRSFAGDDGGYVHVLDVIYRSDVTLWPTWTHVPYKASVLGTLIIRIRILEAQAEDFSAWGNKGMASANDMLRARDCRCRNQRCLLGFCGAPPLFFMFYHMLRTLLRIGFSINVIPAHDLRLSNAHPWPAIWVRHLVFDFVPMSAGDSLGWTPSSDLLSSSMTRLLGERCFTDRIPVSRLLRIPRTRVEAPERMAYFLHFWLQRLFSMSSIRAISWAGMLIERVGDIETRFDDSKLSSFDSTNPSNLDGKKAAYFNITKTSNLKGEKTTEAKHATMTSNSNGRKRWRRRLRMLESVRRAQARFLSPYQTRRYYPGFFTEMRMFLNWARYAHLSRKQIGFPTEVRGWNGKLLPMYAGRPGARPSRTP